MAESRVGSEFGPYRLESLLGRGGMGEVYRAHDTRRDRTVALKLLTAGLTGDDDYQERFRRESRAAARLGEPHIVPIHDFGEIDGVLYLDMRLVPGGDLRALLRREKKLTPERAVSIIEQIASALDAAHADGLIHRDVKPENILVSDNDFCYLVDFGIAYSGNDTHLTQVGTAIGSLAYMAPELFDSAPVTASTDIYALACVLFECLTGRVPHPADTVSAVIKAVVLDPPPSPSALNDAVPAAFDVVIAKGLDREPGQRFSSAGALAQAARRALTEDLTRGQLDEESADQPTTVLAAGERSGDTDAPSSGAAPPTLIPQFSNIEYPATQVRQVSEPLAYSDSVPYPTISEPQSLGQGYAATSGPYPIAYPPMPQQPPGKQRADRAIAIPLIGILAVAVVGLLALAAYWVLHQRAESTTAAGPSTPTVTQTITPSAAAPAAPVAPPAGSSACDATVGVGNGVTSCPFAQVVRDEYLRSGPKGGARAVVAYSPVTGISYTMVCAPEGAIVTCRGGNDAVVNIY